MKNTVKQPAALFSGSLSTIILRMIALGLIDAFAVWFVGGLIDFESIYAAFTPNDSGCRNREEARSKTNFEDRLASLQSRLNELLMGINEHAIHCAVHE